MTWTFVQHHTSFSTASILLRALLLATLVYSESQASAQTVTKFVNSFATPGGDGSAGSPWSSLDDAWSYLTGVVADPQPSDITIKIAGGICISY